MLGIGIMEGTNNGGSFISNIYAGNKLVCWSGCNDYITSLAVPFNTWTFVALTFDGANTFKMYLNATSETFSLTNSINTTISKFFVGFSTRDNGVTTQTSFNGKIDEVQVFNKALSATELANVRIGGNPAPTNRVLYYPFNEGTSTAIADAAGTNNATLLNPTGTNWVAPGPSEVVASQNVTLTVTDASSNSNQCTNTVTVIDPNPGVYLAAKVMLAGPYNASTGFMNDNLRSLNLIPTNEPYSASPYNKLYTSNEPATHETVSSSVLGITGQNAIVDWVFLELRSATNSSTVLYTKRALVQRDGDIVSSTDGVSPVYFKDVPFNTSYFISVKHRNHLGVMSAFPVYMTNCRGNNATIYNFMTDTVKVINTYVSWPTFPSLPQPAGSYPYFARKIIVGVGAIASIKALWSADANNDKKVRFNGLANDKDKILAALGGCAACVLNNVYRVEDVNMNGNIRYGGFDNDKDVIINNLQVTLPNNNIFQQTPN